MVVTQKTVGEMNKSERGFILSWDNTGLEAVVELDLAQWRLGDQERLASILSNPGCNDPGNTYQKTISRTLSMLTLRARFNTQRHYEIYYVAVYEYITTENIRDLFDTNPQGAADLMRKQGTKIYSDRLSPGSIKIT